MFRLALAGARASLNMTDLNGGKPGKNLTTDDTDDKDFH
jgi:hypothetical protein